MTCVRRRGFTLIEVLMAAFVMAIGVLGLTALFAGAARQQQVSSQTTRSVAHARSAEAFLANRFGPIERLDQDPELRLGNCIPKNGQGEDDNVIQNDQWYALPRNEQDGSISVNPEESKNGWKNESLYSRSEPREVLPKLLYRARLERAPGGFVETGMPGGNTITKTGFGTLDDNNIGAPALDDTFRELRVIADSIKIRVVTRAFPCSGSTVDERSLSTPDDKELVLTWDQNDTSNGDRIMLKDGANEILVESKEGAKDSELVSTNGTTHITYAYIEDIVNETSLTDEPDCASTSSFFVEFDKDNPLSCEAGASPVYLWVPDNTSEADIAELPIAATDPGYDIILGSDPDKRYLFGRLRAIDVCQPLNRVFREVPLGGGQYILGNSDTVAPPGSTAISPVGVVRPLKAPTRYIHEIWLDDYRYRAHTLVSLPESVTYTQPADATSDRMPQLGYSMVFRRTTDSRVQYALFSYAIAPTYPPGADKPSDPKDDFFPKEDLKTIEGNRQAPMRLVKGLTVLFDDDIGQYYLLIDPAVGSTNDLPGWVATPGLSLLFNGDASANPPIPGADAPVRVVSTRKDPKKPSWVRAYLDGPPRAGLRMLSDYVPNKSFDAWVVSPRCQVTQQKPGPMTYFWGLKPVDTRIFTVGQ